MNTSSLLERLNDLPALSDTELLSRTRELAEHRRKVTTALLHHLREVERRRLFSDRGYRSLFDYTRLELKMSESSAHRMIVAMRMLKELPEIESKIESGELTLSVIARAQQFFNEEGTAREEKQAVLEDLKNKSSREAERELLSRSSSPVPREQVRAVTEELSEVKLVLDQETLDRLEQLRGLLAHSHPGMSLSELVAYMAKLSVQQLDPGRQPKRLVSAEEVRGTREVGEARKPGAAVKREVWRRDQGRCTQCGSTHRVQFDHIRPFSQGGLSTPENLRLLCFHCNQRAADLAIGREKMERARGG